MKRVSLATLFALLILLFTSCHSKRENEVALALEEWIGKEIIIPDDIIFTIKEDTVSYDIYSTDYKIFTFIDSTQCTKCSLKLQEWTELMSELELLKEEGLNLIMVLSPSNDSEARWALYHKGFKFPVSFDHQRRLKKLNSLPSDDIFHTFLLDSDNRIIAVGNPATNPNIKKLYKSLLIDKDLTTDSMSEAPISVSAQSRQLGIIKPHKKINEKFYLSNLGTDTLHIAQIVASCDCIEIKYSSSTIPPNDDIYISMIFHTDSVEGRFNQSANIFFENYTKPIIIRTEGFTK